jgi:hypothetical protein
MRGYSPAYAEIAAPICLHLAERWRKAEAELDECQRRNLEMATITVFRMLASDGPAATERLRRAAAMLKQE